MARFEWEKANRQERFRDLRPAAETVAWWWVFARRNGECGKCGNRTAKDEVVAYSHHLVTTACAVCVEREGLQPRESKGFRLKLDQRERPNPKKRNRRRKPAVKTTTVDRAETLRQAREEGVLRSIERNRYAA